MADPKKREGTIALLSSTGLDRYCGTYIIPPLKNPKTGARNAPLVLDMARMDARDLAEIESDPDILAVTSETPLTRADDVRRYKRA